MALVRIASIMVVMGLLSACTWYHPTKTQAEFQQDKNQCMQNATLEVFGPSGYSGGTHGHYNPITGPLQFDECMKARGYQ